ncbi:MAG: hypothetical protein OZSIB_2350 [Candidatus Ozemobacter sibiricus]|uniref:Uncharacterized protein n=1 Tax=Candidatus Ozemobacter sibiricus TaxID=2268124 RepID=A0A367ZS60_9BACT|nr:MAG: hypothetical protein OZSIB_2350 [Candidatus Ozemobacter sibiricus]
MAVYPQIETAPQNTGLMNVSEPFEMENRQPDSEREQDEGGQRAGCRSGTMAQGIAGRGEWGAAARAEGDDPPVERPGGVGRQSLRTEVAAEKTARRGCRRLAVRPGGGFVVGDVRRLEAGPGRTSRR